VETDVASKHCLESRVPLPLSILWSIQQGYYESRGESAFVTEIPSFASSNAKIAKDYAGIIFNFLRDTFSKQTSQDPCLIFEIGAGHGRLTFLILSSLLEMKPYFEPLGLPARPFVFVLTDFAESCLKTCRQHPNLKTLADQGWLDFAVFDANSPPGPSELRDIAKRVGCTAEGDVPTIAICNYVIDSLVQEAVQTDEHQVRRGLLSVFSTQKETTVQDHTLSSRLSFAWDFVACQDLTAGTSTGDMADEGLHAVVRRYMTMGQVSALVPTGAFKLVASLHALAGSNLMMLVGDKGTQDPSEFAGWREPHLAVHGSFSVMVNFHALRLFFEHFGGFASCQPYLDCFQCGVYLLGPETRYPSLLCMLASADIGPQSVMVWARQLKHEADKVLHPHKPATATEGGEPLIKTVLALLRYSDHEEELFWQFQPLICAQAASVCLNPRTVKDLATDLRQVYKHRFRMSGSESRDVAYAIGEIFVRIGQVKSAAEFFRYSLTDHGDRPEVLLQLSACLQSCGRIEEALEAVDRSIALDPSPAARSQKKMLATCIHRLETVLIGGGNSVMNQTGPLLARDMRVNIRAVFALKEEEARALLEAVARWRQVLRISGEQVSDWETPDLLWGSVGLQTLLSRADITVCVVDVHHKLLPVLLPKLWSAHKHTMTHSPLAYDITSARSLLSVYQATPNPPMWHAVESCRLEEGLEVASQMLEKLGRPLCISLSCVVPVADAERSVHVSVEEYLGLELVHGLVAMMKVTKDRLVSVSASLGRPSSEEVEASENAKVKALVGHFAVQSPANSSASTVGTFVTCLSGKEQQLELHFTRAKGSLLLRREKTAWQMTAVDDRAGAFGRKTLERTVPCVGHTASHQAFFAKVQSSVPQPGFDGSVSQGFSDSALLESVFESVKLNGAPMTFKYSS